MPCVRCFFIPFKSFFGILSAPFTFFKIAAQAILCFGIAGFCSTPTPIKRLSRISVYPYALLIATRKRQVSRIAKAVCGSQ